MKKTEDITDLLELNLDSLRNMLKLGAVTYFDIAARCLKETSKGSSLKKYDSKSFGLEDLGNSTLDAVVSSLRISGKPHEIVDHPQETITVIEKRDMINKFFDKYQRYGEITIVQGSVLSYKDDSGKENLIVYFDNGEERIDFKDLKKKLGIPKKTDLKFCNGNIKKIIGLANGEVSPFMPVVDKISGIYFEENLINNARQNPNNYFDMPLSTKSSLYANVADVYDILSKQIGEKVRVLEARKK
jgi:hypothetical protein